MRKWMRNRLKRKKSPSAADSEKPQAPLQPAYFEAEPTPPSTQVHHSREKSAEEQPRENLEARDAAVASAAVDTSPKSVTPARSPGTDEQQRRRRRRARGRRRGGSGASQVQPPQTPASATGADLQLPQPAPAEKPSKGAVVLAIGLPGSGKSSWFKRHNITPLSSDMLRAILFDDPSEQRYQDLVFSNLRSMLKARLIARRPLSYVDATNLTPHERHGWIKLAKDFGYEAQAVFFDVPVEVCMERNARRQRTVPEDVMRRKAEQLRPPTFEEGFSKITVVRVKQKHQVSG
jgi:predicted kinase